MSLDALPVPMKRKVTMSQRALLTSALVLGMLCGALMAAEGAKPVPVTEGLVAAWDFRGADPKIAKDVTGNGHDAKLARGAIEYVDSPAGKAAKFDGKSVFVVKPSKDFDTPDKVTVDVWVRIDGEPEKKIYRVIATRGGSYFRVQQTPTNAAYFGMKGKANGKKSRVDLGGGKLTPGQWHRITGVYKQPVVELYLNGKKINSTKKPGFAAPAGASITIGAGNSGGFAPFIGCIDQVRVYNIARPPQKGDEKPLTAK